MGWGGLCLFLANYTIPERHLFTPLKSPVTSEYTAGVFLAVGGCYKKTSLALHPDAAARCTEGFGFRVNSQLCEELSGDAI